MNTTTAADTRPEERSILCEEELVRLIKKFRRVCVHVRTYDGSSACSVVCVVKHVIEDVQRGDFEGLVATTYGRTIWLNTEKAPLWLQTRRKIARLTKRIAWAESRIAEIEAKPNAATDSYWSSMLAMHKRDAENDRSIVARAQTRLAQHTTEAVAA